MCAQNAIVRIFLIFYVNVDFWIVYIGNNLVKSWGVTGHCVLFGCPDDSKISAYDRQLQTLVTSRHWRRQLWDTGARAPSSTSICFIFLVTSEPHKL